MWYVTSRLTRLDSDRCARSHDKLQWRPLVSDRLLCLGALKLSIHLAGVVDDLSTVSAGNAGSGQSKAERGGTEFRHLSF